LKILADKYDLDTDHFIILAGAKYRKYLTPQLAYWEAPLAGLRIGQQLSWYIKKLAQTIKEAINKFLKLF
jgi:hypothetical protein